MTWILSQHFLPVERYFATVVHGRGTLISSNPDASAKGPAALARSQKSEVSKNKDF
ncbi:MAG: hypothetical protein U5L00_19605 [Desulfovermiculus sp.]|nr:hypothetical protein [Desulfovermiculus sp.]